jgi:hypothetical protein
LLITNRAGTVSGAALYVHYTFDDTQIGLSIADSGDIGGFTGTYEVSSAASAIHTGVTSPPIADVSGLAADDALPGAADGMAGASSPTPHVWFSANRRHKEKPNLLRCPSTTIRCIAFLRAPCIPDSSLRHMYR